MANQIDYKLCGSDLQLIEITLDPGESVRADVGAMLYMGEGIKMDTGSGGIFKGLKRMIAGAGFFITSFVNTSRGSKAQVAFAAPYPGKIVPIDLSEHGGKIYCQKDSFLCAAGGMEIGMAFNKRLGAGLFGGEGFILQSLKGDGMAFIHVGGAVMKKELAAGEVLRLDTGCLAAFEKSVDFSIKFIGGFKNALFGGDGVFIAKLVGPGNVYIQSLPFSRLADRIGSAFEQQQQNQKKKQKK